MRLVTLTLLVSLLCTNAFAAAESQEATQKVAAKPAQYGEIILKGNYPEGSDMPGVLSELTENMSSALARFEKAADDEKIAGLILKFDLPMIGWGKVYEFQQAIKRVQAKGKKVYAWMDRGLAQQYLLASVCDEVIMPESGVVLLSGLRMEVSFYKNLFDKLDIQPDMLRVGEYKGAAEPYTRTEMSDALREELTAILDDFYTRLVSTVAENRKMDKKAVEAAIDQGPFSAETAKELGLVDRLAYVDEIESHLKQASDSEEFKIVQKYGKKKADTDFAGFNGMIKMMNLMMGIEPVKRKSKLPKIAIINATGMIIDGRSQSDLFGSSYMGSQTMINAINTAAKDETVKAILLRVDSPGGSALASDLMWRALEEAGKPIVVSMGDTAASGGYYIAMGADTIFAEPWTITGSIGVVGGKLALNGLYEKMGINTSVISRGQNSGALSPLNPMTNSERAAFQKLLNDIYKQFTTKAAAGRKMKYEDLEKLARGRVYTGAMAQKIGLVDKLGTMHDAYLHAIKLAGLSETDKVEKLVLPKPVSPFEALFGPIETSVSAQKNNKWLSLIPEPIREVVKQATVINQLAKHPAITVMPFTLQLR